MPLGTLLKSFFKKDHQVRNIYHPDIKDNIEFAFELKGVKYYRFKQDHFMHEMRRFQKVIFLTELENGLTHEDLLSYIAEIKKHNNKGQLGDTGLKLELLEQRVKAAKDPDTFYRIATVDYFDENEELTHYNKDYNKKKFEVFKNSENLSFFLTKPMSDIFPQLASLALDSRAFLNQIKEMQEIKEQIDLLTFEQSFKEQSIISTES